MSQVDHARFYGEARVSWKDAALAWAKEAPKSLKPRTVDRYLVSLGQVRPFLDDLYLDEISGKTIAKIAGRPASNATRRRDLTAVSVVLKHAVAQGWLESNPARSWDRSAIRERRDPIILPSPEDIDAMVALAPGNFARLIRFAQFTGMRQEEAASLEWPQVHLDRGAVDLARTKTNTPRSVPLDDRAAGTLAGTARHLKSRLVFWHGDGGGRYANVAARFAALTKRAEAKKLIHRRFRFHDLRHWYAVDHLRRGGSIYDLQKILGHSSVKTTEIYLNYLTPDEAGTAKGPARAPAQI